MSNRRSFSPKFKAKVVPERIGGGKSQAQLGHQHQLSPYGSTPGKMPYSPTPPRLRRAKPTCGERDAARVAELERLVGRFTLEVDIPKNGFERLAADVEERRALVKALAEARTDWPVARLCAVLGVAHSNLTTSPFR